LKLRRIIRSSAVAAVAAATLASCDVEPSSTAGKRSELPPQLIERQPTQRQVKFLNRLRAADPEQRTIQRAVLNETNELGLILHRDVPMDKIPDLMRSMLTEMAGEFPGQNLTALAYAPTEPPRKIGTARLNAETRDMSYTPEQ
jgi:hypothetical protein